jgi:hypothetical protein
LESPDRSSDDPPVQDPAPDRLSENARAIDEKEERDGGVDHHVEHVLARASGGQDRGDHHYCDDRKGAGVDPQPAKDVFMKYIPV